MRLSLPLAFVYGWEDRKFQPLQQEWTVTLNQWKDCQQFRQDCGFKHTMYVNTFVYVCRQQKLPVSCWFYRAVSLLGSIKQLDAISTTLLCSVFTMDENLICSTGSYKIFSSFILHKWEGDGRNVPQIVFLVHFSYVHANNIHNIVLLAWSGASFTLCIRHCFQWSVHTL